MNESSNIKENHQVTWVGHTCRPKILGDSLIFLQQVGSI